ncbi:small subunit processome component 20 homolog isoform X2 [Clavelina lepadiformis]|uniref:small subunit processome component 20 homolog isoform X2 n=1 Tax=Clavelina lepadiformis TaxID=159417 RepID=UPI004041D575
MPASAAPKHKEKNQFRFKTFSERIALVNVDGIHRIRRREDVDEEEDFSEFLEAMKKWRDLDLSAHFVAFRKEVSSKCKTYKMIIHYKDDLIQALQHHLQVSDSLAYHGLLELLVALCKDLSSDFYPHFPKFFIILTQILKCNDPERLEQVFLTLSLLFGQLWRLMICDIENVLSMYKILLSGDHPAHIQNFAGESISFLLRKTSDIKSVLGNLFLMVCEKSASSSAVGYILFYMLRSSQNHFHSSTDRVLPVILSFLKGGHKDKNFPCSTFSAINFSIKLMAEHTRRQYAVPVWKVLINEISTSDNDDVNLMYVNFLLKLLNTWCSSYQCSRLVCEEEFVNALRTCFKLCEHYQSSDQGGDVFSSASMLLSTVLHGSKSELKQLTKSEVIRIFIELDSNYEVTIQFFESIFGLPDFEDIALRPFLIFCQKLIQLEEWTHMILKLIVKYSLKNEAIPLTYKQLQSYSPSILNFAAVAKKVIETRPCNVIKNLIENCRSPPTLWYALVAAQHIRPFPQTASRSVLDLIRNVLSENMVSPENLAVASIACQTLVILHPYETLQDLLSIDWVSLLNTWKTNFHFLMILELILNKAKNFAQVIDCETVKCSLEENVSSHSSHLRLLSLKILQQIDTNNELIYEACILCEGTTASIQDARQKILHISKLQKHAGAPEMADFVKRIMIRFLFANFYINFSSLWPPVQEVICSHAVANKKDEFWVVVTQLLKNSMDIAIKSQWWKKNNTIEGNNTLKSSEIDVFDTFVSGICFAKENVNTRPSFYNFRLQLWKTLSLLPQPGVIESFNRILVGLLFQFLENEYYIVDQWLAPSQDLNSCSIGEDGFSVSRHCKKNVTCTLTTIFLVFARFHNLDSAVQSKKLKNIFYEFLSHLNAEVQQAALKCIMTYKLKGVMKFKEKLFDFFDDKKFRDNLTHFIPSELDDDDRQMIMPVLLRLLFGRMKSKTGASTGGKSLSATRCSIIVRYLGSVNEKEMRLFLELVLDPYNNFANKSILECVSIAEENAKNSKIIVPLARQQGILGTIDVLIDKQKQNLPIDSYSVMMKVLLSFVVSHTTLISQHTSDSSVGEKKTILSYLKLVKKMSRDCLLNLLNVWPDPKGLSKSEIAVLFDRLVWPELPKLIHESSGNPGFLLKLFDCFAKKPKFMLYLVKINLKEVSDASEKHAQCALEVLLNLMSSSKCSTEVTTHILNIVTHLLFSEEDSQLESSGDLQSIVRHSLNVVGNLAVDINLDKAHTISELGTLIVTPYVSKILEYFVRKLRQSKKGLLLPSKHLDLLTVLSRNITMESMLLNLSELLIAHINAICLKQGNPNFKSICTSLKTLSHIIKGPRLLPQISCLFSKLSDRDCRLLLVDVLNKACESSLDLSWTCSIVTRLNAWNKRFVEEMDFDARLTAFQDIFQKLNSDNCCELFEDNCFKFLPIIHCCMHTVLTNYSDLSLRESVFRVLDLVISKVKILLEEDFETGSPVYSLMIKNLILSTVQIGIKSADEGCRHESIQILAKIVSVFPNEPFLEGLMTLTNATNPDDDFFENVRHIQMHRRARAYRKLANALSSYGSSNETKFSQFSDENEEAQVMKNGNAAIPSIVARRYLLPLALQTLNNQDFTKLEYLRDACIELVRSCASGMQWSAYKRLLLRTIWNLQRYPHAIEIICAILEVFPYDLANINLPDIRGSVVPPVVSCAIRGSVGHEAKEEDMLTEEEHLSEENVMENGSESALYRSIYVDVTDKILPKLNKILSSKNEDDQHKLSSTKADIDQYKKKIPLAIAITSLLRKMPIATMKASITGVIIKVIGFLRHKLHDIRVVAVETIVTMFQQLGIQYLFVIVKELKSGLAKGFQRHVITHVINNLLNAAASIGKIGMFDYSLNLLLEVLNEELFGALAAEKVVDKLKAKIPEARGRSKAYNVYKLIATFISKDYIMTLIEPLKNHLNGTHKHTVKNIAKEVFSEINAGLLSNSSFSATDLLSLVHGLVTENIPSLFKENFESVPQPKDKSRKPPSCLLLQEAPARYGFKSTVKSIQTNLHVIVEFALQLLHHSMKRHVVNLSDQLHLEMLDPLVPCFAKCLKSTHQQTVVNSARCITKLLRADLPSMAANCKNINASLFKILKNHTNDTGNQEVAAVSFKCLSVMCSTDHGKSLSDTQLQILLTYSEEDLYDSQRQSHAFSLLKSIMKKGLKCDSLLDIMDKVKKIAIQSQVTSSRALASNLYLYFIVNYPMTLKKLDHHLEFVLAQLTYEYEAGRLAAIELLLAIINDFPLKIISSHSGVLFIPTAAVLINDESPTCRKAAGEVIKVLIGRLEHEQKNELFTYVMQWYRQDDTVLHQKLGSLLLSIFTEVDKTGFHKHISDLLPLVHNHILQEMKETDEDDNLKAKDHALFHHLSAFLSIVKHCAVLTEGKWQNELSQIFQAVQTLLTHPHDWIRFICAQIMGSLFASCDPAEIIQTKGTYLTIDLESTMFDLAKCFCNQLRFNQLKEQHAEQIIKNILYICRVLDLKHQHKVGHHDDQEKVVVHRTILFILRQLLIISKNEQTLNPKDTTKRMTVLKFIAAFSLNIKYPERMLNLLLNPVYRGINASATHGSNEIQSITDLKSLSSEVLEIIKQKFASDIFARAYLKVSQTISHKQRKRKREKAVQLVANPVKAAAAKIRKHERTKQQRKRKIATMRPEYGAALSKRAKSL